MPTATNPQTGEKVELINGKWVPIGQTTPQQMQPPPSRGEVATRNLSSGFLQNLAQIPANYLGSFVDAFHPDANQGQVSAGDIIAGGLPPSQSQILGAGQVLGERAGQMMTGSDIPVSTMQQATQNQQQITDAGAEAYPITNAASDIGADVATLAAGRMPMSRNRALFDVNQAHGIRTLVDLQKTQTSQMAPAAKSVWGALRSSFGNSPLVASISRGGTKAAESAFDGFILGALNNQDPLQTAAIGAGAQASGSLMLSMLTGFSGAGSIGTRFAITAASAATLMQVARSLTPGDDSSSIVGDIGFSVDKILWGIGFGLASAVGGAGRLTGTKSFQKWRSLLPEIVETTQTMQRGISLGALNNWLADDRVEPILNELARDPMAFGSRAARRIDRAITNSNVDLSETIDGLMRDSSFKEQFESLGNNPRLRQQMESVQ